jgi:putative ABC transport system ATP-binding protein
MNEASAPLIRLGNMSKVFFTDEVETHALSGIHLDIMPGEFISIAGPSGCGKSTLLSILGLLDTPPRASTGSTASPSLSSPLPSAPAPGTARSASSSRAST